MVLGDLKNFQIGSCNMYELIVMVTATNIEYFDGHDLVAVEKDHFCVVKEST